MAWHRKLSSKFGNKRTELAGRSFMSKGEADCYLYLKALQDAGEISDLQCQVTVRLTAAQLRWVLDFKYLDMNDGREYYADFKGFETSRWRELKKLWVHYGDATLRVYKGSGMRMRVAEEITPKGEV